jgi:hypothetical protein
MTRFIAVSSLLLAGVIGALAQTAPTTVTFSNQTYNTGPRPVSVVSGDFNGDGKPDLAVIDNQTSSVQVLLNTGAGQFTLGSQTNTGTGPVQIVTGTFNLTGHQSLAVANSDKTMTVLLGLGDGSFTAESFPLTGVPMAMVAGDFLNDGLTQLATVECASQSQAPCTLNVYQSDAHALFSHSLSIALPAAPFFPGLMASDDFVHDHKPGLALATDSQVLVYDNTSTFNGTGSVQFTLHSTIAPPNTSSIIGLAAGHFIQNNPTTDLAIETFDNVNDTNFPNSDYVYLNNGFGLFSLKGKVPGSRGFGHTLTVSDINGDGIQDLLFLGTSVHDGSLSYSLGKGDGTFTTNQSVSGFGGINRMMIARDLSLDSRQDLAVTSGGPLGGPAFTGVLLNQNAATNCPPPGSATLAVKFCSATTTTGKISVSASGNSSAGVKRIELWVDGVKKTQAFSDQLHATVNAATGNHQVTAVGADLYDALAKTTVTVHVP